MKHVAFLGPEVFDVHLEFVRALKESGATVTGIGLTNKARLSPTLSHLLDHYEQIGNILDPDQVAAAASQVSKLKALDRIEAVDESMVMAAAGAREKLGLPGLSTRSALLCRDKPMMKEALREAGVACAASDAVASLDELHAFVEKEGLPVILKPRASVGSIGTTRIDDMEHLDKVARQMGIDRGMSVAVEEFVEGHEGYYDTISIDGEPALEFVSHYFPNVLPSMRDRTVTPIVIATNKDSDPTYAELYEMGRKVIKVLGINTSATHMEWFFGPKGLKFSEIGARPVGERLWDLYCYGNQMDVYREWANAIVHGRVEGTPTRRFSTGSIQIRPDRDGHVAGYKGLDVVLKKFKPYLFAVHIPRPGEATVPIEKGYLHNLWLRLRHPDFDELKEIMDLIGKTVKMYARG